MGIILNIANVVSSLTVLGDDPELSTNESVANGDTASLAGLAAGGFEDRSSRNRHADSKQKFDRRIEQVFLKNMDNVTLHWL